MDKQAIEIVAITSELIKFETVSPQGNEYKCARFLADLMGKIGMRIKTVAKRKNRTNVIGEIGGGKKSLVIACHMDTVKLGDGWTVTEPLKPVVKNGKIYGRGAIDDKGPFAVAHLAVKQFIGKHPNFDGKIYLVAMADEEADNVYGAKYLLSQGFMADAGLMVDGGYLNSFDYGEKGCVQLVVESFGKQEHSGLQENGQNAVENLIRLITRLKTDLVFEKFDNRFSPLRLNVSKFHGGEIPNTIPAYAKAQMDIRFPLGPKSSQVLKKLMLISKREKGEFKFCVIYKTEPHAVENKKLTVSFIAAAKDISLPMKPITIGGNSVAKEFTQAGIPSIVHVPATTYTAHEPNECAVIEEMIAGINLYSRFLEKYFETR